MESKKDKIIQGKMCVWMGLLLAELGFYDIRENTTHAQRYEANKQLKYVQNVLKQMFVFNKSKSKDIHEAETTIFENVALIKGIAETMAMLPPEFVDDFESEYLKFYDTYIKRKISELESNAQ